MEENDKSKNVVMFVENENNDDKCENTEISNSSVNTDDIVRNLDGNNSETSIILEDNLLNSSTDSVINNCARNSVVDIENDGIVLEKNTTVSGSNAEEIDALNVTDFNEGSETENVHDKSSLKDASEPKTDKICQLPLGRVKTIIKSDPDVNIINLESVFLISKATELFLQWLGKEVHSYTIQQKRKTIQIRDLHMAISEHPALEFLDGALN